ncbi:MULTISPECIES: methyl-accepting chemotaxis protein [Undibacterium]|nr:MULTISPECIES: methyl-accepting chemotaxis protein [Undibacterium]
MKLANMKVRNRMIAGFGSILIFVMAISVVGLVGMMRENEAMHQIVDINVKKMALLEDMSNAVHITSRVVRTIALLDGEGANREPADAQKIKITEARQHYDAAFERLQKMPLDKRGQEFVREIDLEKVAARKLNDDFLLLEKSDRTSAVRLLMEQVNPAVTKWQDGIHEFILLQREKNVVAARLTEEYYAEARNELILLSLTVISLSSFLAVAISRSLTRQLGCEPNYAIAVAYQIAKGNLCVDVEVHPKDQSSLIFALRDMRDKLSHLVGAVNLSAETIASASREIAHGNLDLSSRTEEQAASLEETAASLEELTSTVKHNAENAREADTLAKQASSVAVNGGDMVNRAVMTMEGINEASKQIVEIISVIDGIAFQTNILALNAAVEAARAGEQGRGFAVVASEVRSLAQRSAAAAKEIKVLIANSVEQVGNGTRIVDQAGIAMHEVVDSIRRVSSVINEIANASHEQTNGIDQINVAVIQMDQVTQQNAALVEEAAAAAEALENQASNLSELVHTFKIETLTHAARVIPKRVQSVRERSDLNLPKLARA